MIEPVDREGLRALGAWAPVLEAVPVAGTWEGGSAGSDGVIQMPWLDYDETLLRFIADASRAGFVQPFDWMAWAGTERARELIADPISIATATADELVRLLTTIVRGDRFSEGAIAGAFERGSLLAIARRAADLATEEPAAG